jgi:hypothetical protein
MFGLSKLPTLFASSMMSAVLILFIIAFLIANTVFNKFSPLAAWVLLAGLLTAHQYWGIWLDPDNASKEEIEAN